MTPPDADRWPDEAAREAAAALPPGRDDEPASLRQDILDELADHLGCAFRRELLRTQGDATAAERNLRDRFGDPRRVARRLWFDAMKGKLMAQKVVVGTCAAVVAVCVLFGVLLWRAAAEARAAHNALLAEARRENAALLARLDRMAENTTVDAERSPLVVRCVTDSADGPPAAGVEVRIAPDEREQRLPEALRVRRTGDDGTADFGLRWPGDYHVEAKTSWGERSWRKVRVELGQPLKVSVVCPSVASVPIPIRWNVAWPTLPAPLEPESTWCIVCVNGYAKREVVGESWFFERGPWPGTTRLLAFHPDGRVLDLARMAGGEWPPKPAAAASRRTSVEEVREYVAQYRDGRSDDPKSISPGEYRVVAMALTRWDGQGGAGTALAGMKSWMSLPSGTDYFDEAIYLWWFADRERVVTVEAPSPAIIVKPVGGEPMAWTLPIPERLLVDAVELWDRETVYGAAAEAAMP